MLYQFQVTYRVKGSRTKSPVHVQSVLGENEKQAADCFNSPELEVISLQRLRPYVPPDQEVLNGQEAAEFLRITGGGFYGQVYKGILPKPKDGLHKIPREYLLKRIYQNMGVSPNTMEAA